MWFKGRMVWSLQKEMFTEGWRVRVKCCSGTKWTLDGWQVTNIWLKGWRTMSEMCTQHQNEISPLSCSAVQPKWTDWQGLVSRMSLPVLKEQGKRRKDAPVNWEQWMKRMMNEGGLQRATWFFNFALTEGYSKSLKLWNSIFKVE